MNPITDDMSHCILCGSSEVVKHHLCSGTANRQKSEDYLLFVPLCPRHHNMSNNSMHLNPEMMKLGKIIGQLAFEKQYVGFNYTPEEARAKFIKEFGKSFV